MWESNPINELSTLSFADSSSVIVTIIYHPPSSIHPSIHPSIAVMHSFFHPINFCIPLFFHFIHAIFLSFHFTHIRFCCHLNVQKVWWNKKQLNYYSGKYVEMLLAVPSDLSFSKLILISSFPARCLALHWLIVAYTYLSAQYYFPEPGIEDFSLDTSFTPGQTSASASNSWPTGGPFGP